MSVLLVMTTAIMVGGMNPTVSVSTTQRVFDEGFRPIIDCRLVETGIHQGSTSQSKVGNKTISKFEQPNSQFVTEYTTMCIEMERQ